MKKNTKIAIAVGVGGAILLAMGKKGSGSSGAIDLPDAPVTTGEDPPRAPQSQGDLDLARTLAPDIAADIAANGMGYNRTRLRDFQRAARLYVDGLYGPRTAGALIYFLAGVVGPDAPAALYDDGHGRKTPYPYTPPAGN